MNHPRVVDVFIHEVDLPESMKPLLYRSRVRDTGKKQDTPRTVLNYLTPQVNLPTNLNTPTKDSSDKWQPEVENAFLEALRLIVKNGSAKVKFNNKNYGRNELISFYILCTTGEDRSKKQISSHIQVLKKTIQSKSVRSVTEQELLDLIEYGPIPGDYKKFTEVFTQLTNSKKRKLGDQSVESVPKLSKAGTDRNSSLREAERVAKEQQNIIAKRRKFNTVEEEDVYSDAHQEFYSVVGRVPYGSK